MGPIVKESLVGEHGRGPILPGKAHRQSFPLCQPFLAQTLSQSKSSITHVGFCAIPGTAAVATDNSGRTGEKE